MKAMTCRVLLAILLALAFTVDGAYRDSNPLAFRAGRFLATLENGCAVVEECSLCDAGQRSEIAECRKTGRVERYVCETPQEEEEEEGTGVNSVGAGTTIQYRSCARTKADDEFLMVRLQVICVLIGTAAFVNARKQKVMSASLFDQRKLGLDAKRRRRDSSTPQEVELSNLDETKPLTADVVDVV